MARGETPEGAGEPIDDGATGRTDRTSTSKSRNGLVAVYVVVLAAAAVLLVFELVAQEARPPGRPSYPALVFLAGLLVAAEYLFVRFRFRGETNALNLVEAALAPLLWAFPGAVAMATVAGAQLTGDALRRNSVLKASFNIAQWTLAAGLGALTLVTLSDGTEVSLRNVAALAAAQGVVALVNHAAFTIVLSIVNRQSPRAILTGSVLIPGWFVPWIVNWLTGMLFVLAYEAHPAGAALFPIPLVVLHLAYRGYAGARSDRVRLAGLHEAAQALAEPLDPRQAIAPFLREVTRSFEARAAALVLRTDGGCVVHRLDDSGSEHRVTLEPPGTRSLESAVATIDRATRITARKGGELTSLLLAGGWRDCLVAPLAEGGKSAGVLVVYDQAGLEGFEAGEAAVIEALGRETASTLAKGRLLETILDERRKLAEIVETTSDGILTLNAHGVIESWNPAMETLTGIPAGDIVDRAGGLRLFQARTDTDAPVDLAAWVDGLQLPAQIRISRPDGSARLLACSYSHVSDARDRPRTLVMVARDITSQAEMQELRERFGRLAEAEAAQRAVVDQLQQAVMPPRPVVRGVELGVSYLSSDPTSPTGGDLYDWYSLPDGNLHIAVVDVLGHGVSATQDALAVVHALRILALQGCPLERAIAEADRLLCTGGRELVATLVVARYDPLQGRIRLAGGGHPPPLLVSRTRGVSQLPLPGGPIGWPNAGSRATAEAELAPGDTIVFYTDGLVESHRNIITGTDTLIRHVADLSHLSAEAMAGQLLHRALTDADRRDDSLALVVRHEPMPTTPDRASWRIPPDRKRAREVRHSLGEWLHSVGVRPEASADVELVAGELLANAVEHGRSTVAVRAWVDPGVVLVEVEDDGIGRDDLGSFGHEPPSTRAEAGRGLFIVRSLADEVTVLSAAEGTIVRCTINVARQASSRRPSAQRAPA